MTDELHKYRRRYKAGEVLLQEGDPGSEMYLLERGTVDIVVGGRTVDHIDARASQDFIGEVAAILGTPRTASVIAATDCVVLCLPNIELDAVLECSPTLGSKLVRSLCRKLAGSASALASAQAIQTTVAGTGSTGLSVRNYMKGVLGLIQDAAAAVPEPAVVRVLEYFVATNPWGISRGDSSLLLPGDPESG